MMSLMAWDGLDGRRDRKGERGELAQYAQLEYPREEASWVLARLQSGKQRRRRGRWPSFFHSRRTRGLGSPAPEAEQRIPTTEPSEVSATACSHGATEYLGSGGSTTYRSCLDCGAVLVSGAQRTLLIPGSRARTA